MVTTTTESEDYEGANDTLVFDSTHTRDCHRVTILDDGFLEGQESFLALLLESLTFVTLSPQNATVIINDNDGEKNKWIK